MRPERDHWNMERKDAQGDSGQKKPEAAGPRPTQQEKGLPPAENMRRIVRSVHEKDFAKYQEERKKKDKNDPERLQISERELGLVKRVVDEVAKERPNLTTMFMHEGSDMRAAELIKGGRDSLMKRIFENRAHPLFQLVLRGLEEGRDKSEVIAAIENGVEAHLQEARKKAMSEREREERELRKAAEAKPPASSKSGKKPDEEPKSGWFGRLIGR